MAFSAQPSDLNTRTAVMLPVVLYGCETWCLGDGLRVSETRVARVLGPESGEVCGE